MGNKKIFCIGLRKTGTLSLHEALILLGYRSLHDVFKGNRLMDLFQENMNQGKKLLDGLETYDAFLGFNVKKFYKILDQQYPDSQFIFTGRDFESWMRSNQVHAWVNRKDPFYKFDFLKIDKEKCEDLYLNHTSDVLHYFKEKPSQLLIFRICDGEGWKTLCPFLGKPIPRIAFPRKNTMKDRFYKLFKNNLGFFWQRHLKNGLF